MSNKFTFTKPRWDVLKDTKVYETPIFSLHQVEVLPDKETTPKPFYVIQAPEWINVMALTESNEVVLVEQYRFGVDESTLEIPGGMVDAGESPLEAAKRELLEETGFSSDNWEFMGKTSANPAIFNNYAHLYIAKNCRKTAPQQTDGTEDIAIHILPINDFLNLVKDGTVHHAIVLAAMAKFLLKELKVPDKPLS